MRGSLDGERLGAGKPARYKAELLWVWQWTRARCSYSLEHLHPSEALYRCLCPRNICAGFHITDGEESKIQKSSVMYRDHMTSESWVRLRTQVSLIPEPWYSFTKSSQRSELWREGTAPRAGTGRGHRYTHPSVWIHLWAYNWLGRGGVFWKCRHLDILIKIKKILVSNSSHSQARETSDF